MIQMKKLLVLTLSLFFLSSPSVFAETYFCSSDSSNITLLKRQGMEFSYKSPSITTTMQIVHEDEQSIFLMGNFYNNGSTAVAINKKTNETTSVWLSGEKGESSAIYEKKCIKD
jgi:hypothetical protein